jgi:hypothetical protein
MDEGRERGDDPLKGGGKEKKRMSTACLWRLWRKLGVSRLMRSPHVQACLLCKAMVDGCAMTENAEYIADAVKLMKEHANLKKNISASPRCRFADCIHHEDVSRELGLAILRLGGETKPWRDDKGVPVGLVPILAKPDDKPPGFVIGKDAAHHGDDTPPAAEIYVRLGMRKTTVHVWISPAFSSRHEDAMEAVGVWELKQTYETQIAGYRDWVMAKWLDYRALAEMEVSLGNPKEKKEGKDGEKREGGDG